MDKSPLVMYILQDKNLQDKLSTTGWARDWVWSIAYVMVQKFIWASRIRTLINCSIGNVKFNKTPC